jgi:hypothetical protein
MIVALAVVAAASTTTTLTIIAPTSPKRLRMTSPAIVMRAGHPVQAERCEASPRFIAGRRP